MAYESFYTDLALMKVDSTPLELLNKISIPHDALFNKKPNFTIGPDVNEALGLHKFGPSAHRLHILDKYSVDIFVIRQSMIFGFNIKMKAPNRGLKPASRELKNVILRENVIGK